MRPLRVLITSDAVGGVASHARTLAAALARRGHRIQLAIFGARASEALHAGVEHACADLRLEWMDGPDAATLPEAMAQGRRWLAELAAECRPDVLHCNQFAYVGCLPGVPSLLAVHSDVRSWWRHVRGQAPPDDAYQRWYRGLAEQALASAAVIAAPSRAAARDLSASFAPRRRVEVIANGVDAFGATAGAKEPLAVSLARTWDPAKQIALLGACERARAAGWELAVAGETAHPATQATTPAPPGVRLLGALARPQAEALLARASIYIAASCYEPFGLAPVEAAASGCALVLNDIPTFREIWGDAAVYFKRNRAAALDGVLGRLVAQPAAIQRLAHRAGRRARQFSPDAMAAAYEAAYRRCLP
jgi:glycogen(starch) synthase